MKLTFRDVDNVPVVKDVKSYNLDSGMGNGVVSFLFEDGSSKRFAYSSLRENEKGFTAWSMWWGNITLEISG